jgi:hypothetical protein
MFGISAFAQSPFAALGGNAFPVDIAESFTLSDVYAAQAAFEGLVDEELSFPPMTAPHLTSSVRLTTLSH